MNITKITRNLNDGLSGSRAGRFDPAFETSFAESYSSLAMSRGLRGVMYWELNSDRHRVLGSVVAEDWLR